jgi:hypothetical protein
MVKGTWLVTVAARGREHLNGVSADVVLRRTYLGGVIRSHGFGPGSVDLELEVASQSAARACADVRHRLAGVLGSEWAIDVTSRALYADSVR